MLACAAVALTAVLPARAQLTLTAAGVADGFTLTTFSTAPGYYNPIAAAVMSDGKLLVSNLNSEIARFNDVDGQVAFGGGSTALATAPFYGVMAVASVGGSTYAGQWGFGNFYKVETDLSYSLVTFGGLGSYLGLWGNATNGHLLASAVGSSGYGLYDINPLANTNVFVAPGGFDGVSVSNDGKWFYAENGGNIDRYDAVTHAGGFWASGNGHAPDGTGVISGGTFNGDVVVFNNDGTLVLIDDANPLNQTIIATGAARGDFTSPDTNNGTLFLAASNGSTSTMYRLGITGGSIGSSVPDGGATAGLLAVSLAGLVALRRRFARK